MVTAVERWVVDPIDVHRSWEVQGSRAVKVEGSEPSIKTRRPLRRGPLVAGAVVLIVGGLTLSRDYGAPPASNPAELSDMAEPQAPTVSTSAPTRTVTTAQGSRQDFQTSFRKMTQITDVAVAADGSVIAAGPFGVARLDRAGNWMSIPLSGLPSGTWSDPAPTQRIAHVAVAPDDTEWLAGSTTSEVDDADGWWGVKQQRWIAFHCPLCGEWHAFTSEEEPEIEEEIGDLVVSTDGLVYASVGENLLMAYDGDRWKAHEVPMPGSYSVSPWSSSMAVGNDGVVWAAIDFIGGVFAFDGDGFTRYTTEDGLPSGAVRQVAVGADGTIWAATDRSGIVSFDGTNWTTYTTDDGLLSNSNATVTTGEDGTVWAIHFVYLPYGYSRFDGGEWTSYRFDSPVGGSRAAVDADGTVWTVESDDQPPMWSSSTLENDLVSFDGTARTILPSPPLPPDGSLTFTPVQWAIMLDEVPRGAGVYTAFMIVDARPLTAGDLEDLSGRLIWNETAVDLCGIGLRFDGADFVHVGDIFQTTEGCGPHPTAMQDAFNEFGPPELGCVTVRSTFGEHEFCAELPVVDVEPVEPQPGTVTVSLDRLEGLRGLVLEAWLLPSAPTVEPLPLGGVHFGVIQEDPYSGSEAIHPRSDDDLRGITDATARFSSGTYHLVIEAYQPLGPMYYACERPIEVIEGEWTVVNITSLPPDTGDGWHSYPDCRG